MDDGQKYMSRRTAAKGKKVMSAAGDLGQAFDDVITFSLGDPDLGVDPRILEATYHDMLAGHTHYTATLGQLELRQALVDFTRKDYGLSYSTDECMVTTSANHAMWLICQVILDPGDEVIIFEPYFTPYLDQIGMAGGVPVPVQTRAEDGFLPTESALSQAVSPRTRAIIVNSPSNPTGVVWDEASLQMVATIAAQHDLLVLADDIYTIYDFQRAFTSISTLPGMQQRCVVLRSFSKNYCMAGFRIGYMMGPSALMAAARDINECVIFTPPSVSQRAALAALSYHDEICPDIRRVFERRLTVAYQEVCRTKNLVSMPPCGAIYLWVDIRQTGLTSAQFAKEVFEHAHVAVVPGSAFGASGEGYIRLAATIDEHTIHEAFKRLRVMPLFS